jgi:Protein of unknown function (DUF2793)
MMSAQTPRLGLSLIAAGQAQKHVTHNEALTDIDAVLHLHAESKSLSTPPAQPANAVRYIVGSAPTGAWGGQENKLAIWEDGAWRFLAPRKGWVASVGNPPRIEIFDGSVWRPALEQDVAVFTSLGVNTTPDAANPVAMRVNNILAVARPVPEGGDGGVRVKLSKTTTGDTASLIWQNNYSGRAEIGLLGNDALSMKVSANGSAWRDALRIDPATAEVAFPAGLHPGHRSPNLLINGDFAIRQRGLALGAVAANLFPFDRWRAGAGGANVLQNGPVVTLTSGSLQQVIEPQVFGFDSLAGRQLTLSVQELSGADLTVTIAGQSATLLRSSQPLAVTLLVPAAATGNVTVTLAPSGGGAALLRQVRLEAGNIATGWASRPLSEEMLLCGRYFRKSYGQTVALGTASTGSVGILSSAGGSYHVSVAFPLPMRAIPTVTLYNPATGAGGSWRTSASTNLTPTVDASDSVLSFSGTGAAANSTVFGHFAAEAEL